MSIALPAYVFIYVVVFAILGLFLFYERRAGQGFYRLRRRAAVHCVKCDHLYLAPRDDQLHACPKCGHANPRLRY